MNSTPRIPKPATRPTTVRCRGTAVAAARNRVAFTLTGAALAVLLAACGGGGGDGPVGAGPGGPAGPQSAAAAQTLQASLSAMPVVVLTPDETAGLLFMREEEKLARDVYTALYTAWGSLVFDNIGAAEQTHMDSVKLLLARHALPDPADTTAPGQFTNPALQALYDSLMATGRTSVIDALKVGAEIEDVDIRDLRVLKAATGKADLLLVYENLERSSRNHLRAFHANLQGLAASYTPKYLTQAEYDAIVNTPQERGRP